MSAAGLSILAVDDEYPALADLARMLRASPEVQEVVCASSGGDALRLLSERSFDALFLDVRMPDLDGLELAGVLNRFAQRPGLVFVSAHEDAAVEAFALRAQDFLMKPVSRRRMEEALARVAEHHGEAPLDGLAAGADAEPAAADILPVDNLRGGGTRLLHRSEILYLQAHGDYVRIVSDDGRFLLRGSLTEIERRWHRHGFVRVHRGFVANLRRAVEVRPALNGTAAIVFGDGSEVPVARRQLSELRRQLGV
jgi:DNA-binding LytR/AlgR family response regulator